MIYCESSPSGHFGANLVRQGPFLKLKRGGNRAGNNVGNYASLCFLHIISGCRFVKIKSLNAFEMRDRISQRL